jgi:hypothetical protein
VCENRVLKRLFEFKRHKITGARRKLYNEENLYSSPKIIVMMESRRMRWTENVQRREGEECIKGFGREA